MRAGNRRKHSGGGEDGHSGGGWEVVYSGFAMIMLSFFIMLSSFSTLQEGKVLRFVKSFIDALSVLPYGAVPGDGEAVLNEAPPMVKTKHELASLMNDLKKLAEQERAQVQAGIQLARTPQGVAMRLSDRLLFDLGAAELGPEAKRLLDRIGAIIARTDYQIRIEGHTDDLPIRTDRFPSNWELSTARAVNVLRYLARRGGIEAGRLSAVGFAEHRPLWPNDSPRHRALNRRVEILFIEPAPVPARAG